MNQFVVIAHNLRSLRNVGSIFRTAEGAGVDKLYLTGYTGTPPRTQISNVALGSEKSLPWEHYTEIKYVLEDLRERGFEIVALEQDENSTEYKRYDPANKIAMILGNEVRGVPERLRTAADTILEIPMIGDRDSLNVAVSFGIAGFELGEKLKEAQSDPSRSPAKKTKKR